MPIATTIEPLRWRDPPARANVTVDGGAPRVRLQMTAPREVSAMCVGRPAEELPRILSFLSPAHHLCAAKALDRLFGVEPPRAAASAREALRLALALRHHLRRFRFLVSSVETPFADGWSAAVRRGLPGVRPMLDELARHLAAAQEAAAILGGRADHPVTAVAGGVTRLPRPEHRARLAEIAVACRDFADRLGGWLRERVFSGGELLADVRALDPGPLSSVALAAEGDAAIVRDGRGAEAERFSSSALFERITFRHEPWSHEPFAHLGGAEGARAGDGAFFVGPLARLNGGEPLASPLAEAERGRLVAALGPFPRFEVAAAYWASLVELLAAAEGLAALSGEKLADPALRAIPEGTGREGHAALESPQGLICHRVRVDARGVVEELRVLDAVAANNVLLGRIAQQAVESSPAGERRWEEAKRRMELALLAY
jgi:F420-non-reducing hydrogenase large subunit